MSTTTTTISRHFKSPTMSTNTTLPAPAQIQQISPTPPQVFHFFSQLRTEIRLKIWSMLSPRAVRFQPGGGPAPSVFSVCCESRQETRGRYTLEFLGEGQEEKLELLPAPSRIQSESQVQINLQTQINPQIQINPTLFPKQPPSKTTQPPLAAENTTTQEEEELVQPNRPSNPAAVFINYATDTLHITPFHSSMGVSQMLQANLLHRLPPGRADKVQRMLVGVPGTMEGALGFEQWWWFPPWRLVDTGFGACRLVTFVFEGEAGKEGGDEDWDEDEDGEWEWDWEVTVPVEDLVRVGGAEGSDFEMGVMVDIRDSLDRAREEGYCVGLEIEFVRIEEGKGDSRREGPSIR